MWPTWAGGEISQLGHCTRRRTTEARNARRTDVASLSALARSFFHSRRVHYRHVEGLLLTTFMQPRPLVDRLYAPEAVWAQILRESPSAILSRLIRDRMIGLSDFKDALWGALSAAQLARLAQSLKLDARQRNRNLAASIAAAVPRGSELYQTLSGMSICHCTTLGRTVASLFADRVGINYAAVPSYLGPPSPRFVTNIQTAIRWFAGEGNAGVILNPLDKLADAIQRDDRLIRSRPDVSAAVQAEHREQEREDEELREGLGEVFKAAADAGGDAVEHAGGEAAEHAGGHAGPHVGGHEGSGGPPWV
jgi:hypothetical protein